MMLLDNEIEVIHISKSNEIGEMNSDILKSFSDKTSIGVFEKFLVTAQEKLEKIDVSKPDFDVMVEYESRNDENPAQSIQLWLGGENEKSTMMYIETDKFYLTTPAITKKLRALLINE